MLDLVTFDHLAGVPIHYAREPVAPYGTIGKGPRTCRLDRVFFAQLELCLSMLWTKHPWGKPEVLVSGGCYVEKAGRHGEGRAIDIDALWWKNNHLVTRDAESYPAHYLGIEAILRQHFGTVLDFWFAHGHEDHFHVDNGQPQGWTGRPPTVHAETLFMQAALTHVHGVKVDIDGFFGDETRNALHEVEESAFTNCLKKNWDIFLEMTIKEAFSKI